MAKQNADTQVVLNQNPSAVVVFLRLDDRGQPIRELNSTLIPDIHDIETVSLSLGSTGSIGRFSLKINNSNNKYFVADDMEQEISNLKGGAIIIGVDDNGKNVYNTQSTDVIWLSAEQFLNNRAYNRIVQPKDQPVLYLYYQDSTAMYDTSGVTDESIKTLLSKGVIKRRVISADKLEEFAKSDRPTLPTQKGRDIEGDTAGADSSTITTQASAPPRTSYADTLPRSTFPTSFSDAEISTFRTPSSNDVAADLATLKIRPETSSVRTQVNNQSSLSTGQQDANTYGPEYISEVRLSLNEALQLLQISDVQAAFFEKYGGQLEHGRCVFEPMQLCVIFLSRRFRDESDPNDMIAAFTGYVDNVQDGFDGTDHSLMITGSDVTKLMHVTQANINPSLFTQKLPGDKQYKIWQNRFGGLEGWEIIRLLTVGGKFDNENGEGFLHGAGVFEVRAHAAPEDVDVTSSVFDNTISTVAVLNGAGKTPEEASRKEADKLEKLFFSPKTLHIQTLPFDTSPVQALQSADVFKRVFGMSFSNWQNEYESHLEIATQVARLTNYEFYADGFGEIWYHQPRFHNYHILTNSNPEVYVLRDEDIINSNFTESDDSVITSVYAVGSPEFYTGPKEPIKMVGFYEDPSLVLKYGRRMVSVSHPYVVIEGDLNFFARSYLVRANAGRFVGKVTILGRPEIKVHMPVYIPYRNMVYYIEKIQHNLVFGQQSSTSLTLRYGRKPWEVIPEILDYTERANPLMSAQGRAKEIHVDTVTEAQAISVKSSPQTTVIQDSVDEIVREPEVQSIKTVEKNKPLPSDDKDLNKPRGLYEHLLNREQ